MEYTSAELKNVCYQKDIKMEYNTFPYTPQQSGVSEKVNRTLLDKVRTMLIEINLSKHLWEETVRTAAYQLNRSLLSTYKEDFPAEVFLERIKLHIPNTEDKLEARAVPVRMVEYSQNNCVKRCEFC